MQILVEQNSKNLFMNHLNKENNIETITKEKNKLQKQNEILLNQNEQLQKEFNFVSNNLNNQIIVNNNQNEKIMLLEESNKNLQKEINLLKKSN
jgi:hypothetical protein